MKGKGGGEGAQGQHNGSPTLLWGGGFEPTTHHKAILRGTTRPHGQRCEGRAGGIGVLQRGGWGGGGGECGCGQPVKPRSCPK